jgi:SAM-dependent methyltransferase
MSCPCCTSPRQVLDADPSRCYCCAACGHRWCDAAAIPPIDYSKLHGRNPTEGASRARKLHDRMADISPLLRSGLRVLEIGCAEGSLGLMVRQSVAVEYAGIELSEDAATASKVLTRVTRAPAKAMTGETFDLLLSFHVLEHIQDIAGELSNWRRLLADNGNLLVEVPNQAGHRLLSRDPNPEHTHQFTPASLTALLHHSGFEVERLETGHWESSVYSDSLRVLARRALTDTQRRALLLQRFMDRLPKPFAAWGIGGDFHGYVKPLLDSIPVTALIDNAVLRHGERHGHLAIEAYDPQRHGSLPILVCSVRYREEILRDMAALGIAPSRIVTLDEIFGTGQP